MTAIIARITQLRPGIVRVLGCNPGPMTLQGTNTYLIGSGDKRVLLDVGETSNTEYITSLVSVLRQHNTTIDKIVISHWHPDHIGGLSDVLKCLPDCSSSHGQTEFYVYRASGCVQDSKTDKEDDPLPDQTSFIPLKHHDEIRTEGATLRIHHTPGHTTDHAVLELLEEKAVFSGDCVLGEGTAVFEDLQTYMASLQLLVKLCPSIVYPGHGPTVEEPVTKIQYYIDHRNQREKQILETMNTQTPKFLTTMELVKTIYKDTPEHLHLAAANNVNHHMHKLLKDGKVTSQGDRWCLAARCDKL
ncbi:Endoribonuclease LACTB2 [Chionoecetes opilio]|uniref:Beta-lactamase-like protein 2 homolog n=1 Tax=Chionoecetes opilio TaxID=41210 RepID=A0A8J5D0L4_CHIOP|nr:Endoribonuclease LACTB2 [Chionoecetes opilio]